MKQIHSDQSFVKLNNNFNKGYKSSVQNKAIKSQSDFELKYGLLKAVLAWDIKEDKIVYKDVNEFGQYVSMDKTLEDFAMIKTKF